MNKKSLIIKEGILLTVSTAFVGYGMVTISDDLIIGATSLLIGAAVFVIRGIGKQKGWI